MITGELIHAARVLQQGGVVAYATEYCFGLGCDPLNHAAVRQLLRIKRRPASKGLILIAADINQITPFVTNIPNHVLATWPGPYTWLLDPRGQAPRWVTGDHPRLAVRITDHPQAAALCRMARMALVSTSANRAGSRPIRSYREAMRRFKGEVDYVLPGKIGDAPAPTPIRDAISDKLIRSG